MSKTFVYYITVTQLTITAAVNHSREVQVIAQASWSKNKPIIESNCLTPQYRGIGGFGGSAIR